MENRDIFKLNFKYKATGKPPIITEIDLLDYEVMDHVFEYIKDLLKRKELTEDQVEEIFKIHSFLTDKSHNILNHYIFSDVLKKWELDEILDIWHIEKIDLDAYDAYLNIYENHDIKDFKDKYYGKFDSIECLAEEYIISCYDIDQNSIYYKHIDWSSLGRDLMIEYSESNGHYFRD